MHNLFKAVIAKIQKLKEVKDNHKQSLANKEALKSKITTDKFSQIDSKDASTPVTKVKSPVMKNESLYDLDAEKMLTNETFVGEKCSLPQSKPTDIVKVTTKSVYSSAPVMPNNSNTLLEGH